MKRYSTIVWPALMKRHTLTKYVLILMLCLESFLAATIVANYWVGFAWSISGVGVRAPIIFALNGGGVRVLWSARHHKRNAPLVISFDCGRRTKAFVWLPKCTVMGPPFYQREIYIPIWIGLVLLCCLHFITYLLHKRSKYDTMFCPCGYPRVGLRHGEPCPECGTLGHASG